MKLWGGRFDDEPDELTWTFTTDAADRRLLEDDVVGSIAHVKMLGRAGLLSPAESSELERGLGVVLEEARTEKFVFHEGDEDVHSAVARRLGELVGDTAGKLHTGRSRNDQVALDLRLYLSRAARARFDQLTRLGHVLAAKAEQAGETIVASYSHLQQAQAIPLAHHLLAYGWMLLRDRERFASALDRIAVSPLGAGAGAGSSLPIDPELVATELDLPATFDNSLDAVSSRDFATEYVFCCAQAAIHLSRLGEDLVLWVTSEFGWADIAERHSTGSSALPHKQNPDMAELVRGRSAAIVGDLITLLALQKGLPLGYHRDLQEDKRAVIHADDTLAAALDAAAEMVAATDLHPPEPSAWTGALDAAEGLIQRGVPFDEAHAVVGRLVASLAADERDLGAATQADLAAIDSRLQVSDIKSPAESVASRQSPGGGSLESVKGQISSLRSRLGG